MENSSQHDLLEETIFLELNMARLYSLYHSIFDEDKDFWWRLTQEENNHAALLKSARDFLELHILPEEFLTESMEEIKELNNLIAGKLRLFSQTPPSFKEACELGIYVEKLSYEAHFQGIMSHASDEKIIKIFQRLNGSDKNHAERIQTLLLSRGSQT
jgi:rubrerythrin